MPSPLDGIRIVLVEPSGELNVGSVARILKNMGLQHLVLVHPHCDWLGAEAQKMAVHGSEVLRSAVVVSTLPEALTGCQRAVATVGRDRHETHPILELPRDALPWLIPAPPPSAPSGVAHQSALIFGPEDRGLSNREIQYAHRLVRIPSSPIYPSLNLAQAVAICTYEIFSYFLYSQIEAPLEDLSSLADTSGVKNGWFQTEPAPLEALERFYQQLETLLLQVGYMYPHTAASQMKKWRHLFNRAQPSGLEVAMLQGMLRQMGWASANPVSPPSEL